ncbi:unnamed protein product [Rhizophagus irregularis]|nr:unnamed protein product [Rhizophagus irregularis]
MYTSVMEKKYLDIVLCIFSGHDNRRPIHSKKRLKFPDDPRGIRLRNYLNFTLFTFNKIRILIQYLVAKIGLVMD